MSSYNRSRTVVVCGVPDVLSPDRMSDKLTVHFQSSRSGGGDVAEVRFPTAFTGVAYVKFDHRRDADNVVQFDQVLKDEEFPEDYPLTVYRMTPEVAFYAYAEIDLSLFPDPLTLISSLRSTHRSVHIGPLKKQGSSSVEGPFSALRELRLDLLRRLEFKQTSPIIDEGLAEEVEDGKKGHDRTLLWLDTHVYTYIKTLEQEEWDRCLARYDLTARATQAGDITEVELVGDADPSKLSAAQADLQELVARRVGTLRTQRIECNRADPAAVERVLNSCRRAQNIYNEVCYVPMESHIEVVGPSVPSHLFCTMVKTLLGLETEQ